MAATSFHTSLIFIQEEQMCFKSKQFFDLKMKGNHSLVLIELLFFLFKLQLYQYNIVAL